MNVREKDGAPTGQPAGGAATLHFLRSVCQGHWIDSPDEHESHPGESLVTQSHEVIIGWARARNAMPAIVPGSDHDGEVGVLRFDVPGAGASQSLEHVTWDEWFARFDDRELVMIFQEHLKNGRHSNFFHFNSLFREQG